jgi:hypothetical protein
MCCVWRRTRIVRGAAPEVLRNRRLLRVDAADLVASLLDSDLPPVDQMEVIVRELEESGAALALARPELLVGKDLGFDPTDVLCDAIVANRVGCFVGMTDPPGVARLRSAQPRLVMLTQVFDFDTGSAYSHRSMVLHTDDLDELGWLAVVRCQLRSPAPAFDQYASESPADQARIAISLDKIGIDRCWIVPADADNVGVMLSLRSEVANVHEESAAEKIAIEGAQRLIQRALDEDERLDVTRLFYLSPEPETQ